MVSRRAVALSRPVSGPEAIVAGVGIALVVVLVRAGGLGEAAGVETFVLIFASIVVEALPFILLGALVAAAIEVYVPERAFDRVARMPLALQLPAAALGGFAFPVCECGSVPVARRLIARGMNPAAGLAFMFASPILNPIVLGSTALAYRGRGIALQMVAGRAILGLGLAVITGWAMAESGPQGCSGRDRARPIRVPAVRR